MVPEFFGNFVTVNGVVWPTLEVEEGSHRLRLLNGSDSRFYVLDFDDADGAGLLAADGDGFAAFLVGTDGGLLPEAIELTDSFVLEPGGRLDVVVQFDGMIDEVFLRNSGPAFEPFKGFEDDGSLAGATAADELALDDQGDPVLVDNVMRFSLTLPNDPGNDGVELSDGVALVGDSFQALPVTDETPIRKLGLFEGADEFGRVFPLLGVAEEGVTDVEGDAVPFGPVDWSAPITEDPLLGATEVWQFYNFSEDAHPIHVHLVQYQVVEKKKFWFQDDDGPAGDPDGIPDDLNGDGAITYGTVGADALVDGEIDWSHSSLKDDSGDPDAYEADIFVFDQAVSGDDLPAEEQGWQDTVWVAPGEMVSVAMTFEKPGEYVWHCHILSHEDHEMMRPFTVVDPDVMIA